MWYKNFKKPFGAIKFLFKKIINFFRCFHRFLMGFSFFSFYVFVAVVAFLIFQGKKASEKILHGPTILEVVLPKVSREVETGFSHQSVSFIKKLIGLRHAIDDPNIKGVLIEGEDVSLGFAQMEELSQVLLKLRAKKPVYCYLSSAGSGLYALSSCCTKIFLQPMGELNLKEFFIEQFYFKKLLDTLGVEGFFLGREEYKSGVEPYALEAMSKPVRSNYESLLKSLSGILNQTILLGRPHLKNIARYIQEGPYLQGEALSKKLVDQVGPLFFMRTEIQKKLQEKLSLSKKSEKKKGSVKPPLPVISLNRYTDLLLARKKEGMDQKKKVAVVILEGSIVRGSLDPEDVGIFDSRKDIEAYYVLETLLRICEDKEVSSVIIRMNTGGGEMVASEVIREGVLLLKASGKKIVVSMGDATASGGYWIATAADEIIASPGTITGSIGVFGGRFAFEKFMKKWGVGASSVSTGENGSFERSLSRLSPGERAFAEKRIDECYENFLSLVAVSRKLSVAQARDVAKGRVWTGEQALKKGLVDKLGGFFLAADRAIALAGLDKKSVRFVFYPQEKTFWMGLKEILFGNSKQNASLKIENLLRFMAKSTKEGLSQMMAEQEKTQFFLER